MKKFYVIFTFLFVNISLFIYNGCGDDDPTGPGPSPGSETVTTTISGTVFDESNNPVPGVEVTSGSQNAVTNSTGSFIFSKYNCP